MGPIVACIKGQDMEKMDIKFSKVLGHIKSSVGIDKMLCIGICWGTWYAFKMSVKHDCFTAIAGPHPSLGIEGIYGGNPVTLAEQVKCPAFLLPAGNDPDDVKEKILRFARAAVAVGAMKGKSYLSNTQRKE